MIDFSRAKLVDFVIHFVGNKGLGEELSLSKTPVHITDDFVKETLLRYFLSPFKTDIYHEFKERKDIGIGSVADHCENIFRDRNGFMEASMAIAKNLHNQSVHPKIAGGELYVTFFKDAVVDGELCDAIGIFKTENKETFLKVFQHMDEFDVTCDTGININKLDKGCLIFNTDKKQGYKLSIVDTNNRVAECALYWEEDFLNARLKPTSYYHTKNFMDASRGFCEEVLTEANHVSKDDQKMMLSKSASYFKDKDHFTLNDFEREVLVQPELVEAFRDYRQDYNKRMDLTAVDDFDVSETAVKKNQKYMRSVVKLDKNFHIYIHSRHDFVEKGYDEEKGMKYYKLYFVNEE